MPRLILRRTTLGTFRLALRVTYNGGGPVVARGDIEAPRSSLGTDPRALND